jgi:hypothetical protein
VRAKRLNAIAKSEYLNTRSLSLASTNSDAYRPNNLHA